MEAIEKMKIHMYPYYQDDTDDVLLQKFLDMYNGSPCKAAASLWRKSADKIFLGGIKRFDTGAESTEFQALADVLAYVKFMAEAIEAECAESERTTTGAVLRVCKPPLGDGSIK